MHHQLQPAAIGLGLTLSCQPVFAASQRAVGMTDVLLAVLLLCWVGFPLILMAALLWQLIGSFVTRRRQGSVRARVPDTDFSP